MGLRFAQGKYIAINDCDDWSHPDRIGLQVELFEMDESIQLVTTQHVRIDADGFVQPESDFTFHGDGPMTSMFRKSVFEILGEFCPSLSRGDIEMRSRIASYFGEYSIENIDAPLMLCFGAGGTLSNRTKAQKAEDLQQFRSSIDHFVKKLANNFESNHIGQSFVPINLRADGVPTVSIIHPLHSDGHAQ